MSDKDRPRGDADFEHLVALSNHNKHVVDENRRQAQRRRTLFTESENIQISKENRLLQQQVKDLEEKLEATSAVARTRFMDSKALRKTIRHLEQAWKVEDPESNKREEVSSKLDDFYRQAYTEESGKPENQRELDAELEKTRQRLRTQKRRQPGR